MRILPLMLAGMLTACASDLPRAPASLRPVSANTQMLQISAPVSISSAAGYARTLPAGSTWRKVGSLPEGDVFKIENSVFTVEARHVHEAYLVVRDGTLMGFYLPVEQAYSPLSPRIILPTK